VARAEAYRAILFYGWLPLVPAATDPAPRMRLVTQAAWLDWARSPLAALGPGPPEPPPEIVVAAGQAASLLDPADPWAQSAWVGELHRRSIQAARTPAERRRSGQVFTPRWVADRMVAGLHELVLPPLEGPLRLLDPALGAGVFWEALIVSRLREAPADQRIALYADLCLDHLAGAEIDPLLAAVVACRVRAGFWALKLHQYGTAGAEFDIDPPEGFPLNIHAGDFLATDGTAGPLYDAILGNPPYGFGESIAKPARAALAERYRVARGQFDISWCFFEAALQRLKPGGVLTFLVPDALLGRPEAKDLRSFLLEAAELVSVEHLGPVFPGVAVSSAVVTLRRRSQPAVVDAADVDRQFIAARLSSPWTPSPLPVRLGEVVTVGRGEELGKGDCRPLVSGLVPVLRGEDIAPLGPLAPLVGIPGPLVKPAGRYRAPKVVVVKTAPVPIAAVDFQGHATLQSVYCLHLRPGIPLEPATIAWLLNSPPVQDHVRRAITGTKKLFPQLTQRELAAIPLPSLEVLVQLQGLLAMAFPDFAATGTLEGIDPYPGPMLQALEVAFAPATS